MRSGRRGAVRGNQLLLGVARSRRPNADPPRMSSSPPARPASRGGSLRRRATRASAWGSSTGSAVSQRVSPATDTPTSAAIFRPSSAGRVSEMSGLAGGACALRIATPSLDRALRVRRRWSARTEQDVAFGPIARKWRASSSCSPTGRTCMPTSSKEEGASLHPTSIGPRGHAPETRQVGSSNAELLSGTETRPATPTDLRRRL